MKAFNIVATAALFSATFSLAKSLEDRKKEFESECKEINCGEKFNQAMEEMSEYYDYDKFSEALAEQGEKLREMIKSLESKV